MRRDLGTMLILTSLAAASPVWAEDPAESDEAESAEAQAESAPLPRLGQAPGEPLLRSAPPSIPFGVSPAESEDNVLDFHGYLLVPARFAVLEREDPGPGQGSTALHSPPLIPQRLRGFEYTGVVPEPWVQLDFSYGNKKVSGTAIIASRSVTDGVQLYNPADQLGVNDAFVSVDLSDSVGSPFLVQVGAFTGRYGVMGAYDAGRYGTPLIARTNTVGESVQVGARLGPETMLVVEQGLGGQLGRPRDGILPAGWNDFADVNVGASFVTQLHAGLATHRLFQLGVHYLTAFSRDDRAGDGTVPDGYISVLGADARLTAGRAGHLYIGAAHTVASRSEIVSGVIEVLNARGGPELVEEYLGPRSQGNGTLTTVGLQYDLSVPRLVYGDDFDGKSPDLLVSLFGIGTSVTSDDNDYDGVLKLKAGAELTYSFLSWLGVSGRYDAVRLNLDEDRNAFAIETARLLLHTDWVSRDEFALQYSHFDLGGDVPVRTGYPPVVDPDAVPDQHVFSLSGTFWW
jgi:hypothetical protein